MWPVIFSEPALAPKVESLSRRMLPAHTLLPPVFKSAPSLLTPKPLRISGSRMSPVTLLTWSWEFWPTVVGEDVAPRAMALPAKV